MFSLKLSNLHVPPSCEMLTLYRKELMGLAAVWVVCFHYFKSIFNQWHMTLITIVMSRGNSGVDIFLFLSGIGLYNSLNRNGAVVPFYQRRIKRVVIPWLALSLPYWILQLLILGRNSFNVFLIHWSGLAFWTEGDPSVWYVALILVLYTVYPLIFYYQRRSGTKALALLWGGILLLNIVMIFVCPGYYQKVEIALSRILIFILGCYAGETVQSKENFFGSSIGILYIVVSLAIYMIRFYAPNWIPGPSSMGTLALRIGGAGIALLVIYGSCLLFSVLNLTWLRKALSFLGELSLEIYLLHIFLQALMDRNGFLTSFSLVGQFWILMGLAVLTVVVAYMFSITYKQLFAREDKQR